MSAVATARSFWVLDKERLVWLLDRTFIMGSIVLIPFDLPLIHQACAPLAVLAVLLMKMRGDFAAFVHFVRSQTIPATISFLFCGIALFSVFTNMTPILQSAFQGEAGWTRALIQAALLLITALYPFYLAFSLSAHLDWKELVITAVWWSLPIPLFVGFLQIANLLHVPGLAHLPYIGVYEGGFWRLTSVARESSWFGSFSCVILPFLVIGVSRLTGWRWWGGVAVIVTVLLFVVLGTSKSAYAALAAQSIIGGGIYFVAWRPWRALGKVLFGLGMLTATLLLIWALVPSLFQVVAAPFISKAIALYNIFEPLLLGNTRFVSIGTRFGMSAAGIAMGQDHPIEGVGLGQFGFHAYNYTPLWGVNSETVGWLSNDTHSWPSTSNLYTRLVGEIGLVGCLAYVALRLAVTVPVGLRLLRRYDPNWTRNLCIFSTAVAMTVFDFHRDSFINLDIWVVTAMSLVGRSDSVSVNRGAVSSLRPVRRLFLVTAVGSFCLALVIILSPARSYLASATLTENVGRAIVSPGDASLSRGPVGTATEIGGGHFNLLRIYWGSTNVAARVITHRPDLARAVLGGMPVTTVALSRYIRGNIVILMADKQTTLTFQYRNSDPQLAQTFLSEAIDQTDHAIADGVAGMGLQARQVLRMTLDANPDYQTRQEILSRVAAEDLQISFDVAGGHPNFAYVEHSGIVNDMQSPSPVTGVLFALGLGLLTATLSVIGFLLLPQRRFVGG
jgi:O-antigen ligase